MFISISSLGQEQTKDIAHINNSEYVFEGKVLEFNVKEDKNEILYASYIVNVTDVFKGKQNLKSGTVEFYTKAPQNWSFLENGELMIESIEHPRGKMHLSLNVGQVGVFLGNNVDIVSVHETLNKITISPYCNTMECFYHYTSTSRTNPSTGKLIETISFEGFNQTYQSADEFNSYLKSIGLESSNSKKKMKFH
jgi:hypothetical protein